MVRGFASIYKTASIVLKHFKQGLAMADNPEQVEHRILRHTGMKTRRNHVPSESIAGDLPNNPRNDYRVLGMGLLTCLLIACAAIASLPQWLVSADGVRQLIIRSVPNLRGDVFVRSVNRLVYAAYNSGY